MQESWLLVARGRGGAPWTRVHVLFAVSHSQLCPHQLVDLDKALAAKILVFPLVKWK